VIDHFNLPVSNLEASRRFYERALAPLGLTFLMKDGDAIGFGVETWVFGLVAETLPIPPLHLAFRAASREAVDKFFSVAILAGGRSNGSPGIRAAYDPSYYAAYVLDPDGHNVEAVCRSAAMPNISLEQARER
jgi:catechol 2,3-dioxygenase-like lactoylglutathione lyase family enzyme